jgi:TatA/E family protein of Tat protein translocase
MSTSISLILLFGISGGEILVVLLLVLILFGPKKIPEIARTFGKAINEVKKVQRDINTEINRYAAEVEKPAKQITQDIEGYRKGINEQINKAMGDDDSSTGSSQTSKSENNIEKSDESQEGYSDDLPYPYSENENNPESTTETRPDEVNEPASKSHDQK